ncbi:MAG: transposase [Gammaproteobacteria bacterium]
MEWTAGQGGQLPDGGAALCRGEQASLIDARFYLPQRWVSDGLRCNKAAIPEAERRYRSKSELALAMVDDAVRRGVRFGAIAVDGGYGKEPAFLRQLDRRRQRFVADVHCDQHVYLEDPRPTVPDRLWAGPTAPPPSRTYQGGTRGPLERDPAGERVAPARFARRREGQRGGRLSAHAGLGLGWP